LTRPTLFSAPDTIHGRLDRRLLETGMVGQASRLGDRLTRQSRQRVSTA
jgi:hypothetical protein